MREIGATLFDATIGANSAARVLYRQSLELVEQRRQRGHADLLRIAVSCTQEKLERLPWELLFDSNAGPMGGQFLGAADYISIQRVGHLRGSGAWRGDRPVRLLAVVAAPVLPPAGLSVDDLYDPVVDTLALYRFIERLKRRSGPVLEVSFLYGPDSNPRAVQNALAAGFDIMYFIGHSQQLNGQTWFLLEDGSSLRRSTKISATELASMLRTSGVECVFLSSCDSLAAAAVLARFEHLHSIVAMQTPMPVIAAAAFDEAVISAIVARCSVERSVQRGRQEICSLIRQLMTVENWEPTDRPEWAIPVLYVNDHDRESTSALFEGGLYQVGIADGHNDALSRCGWQGELPSEVTICFRPAASPELRGFAVAHGMVTNDQYRYYLEQAHSSLLPIGFDRHADRIELGRRPGRDDSEEQLRPDDPVTGITRTEAEACCRWSGRRLPSADEYDVGASHGVLNPPISGRILEWTSDERADDRGKLMAVVVGAREDVPHTCLPGFFALRDPRAAYPDVGFRMADDV